MSIAVQTLVILLIEKLNYLYILNLLKLFEYYACGRILKNPYRYYDFSLIVIAYIKECRGLPVSDLKNKFDPEIWTLSLLGDVFGFIDEAFSDIDIKQRDALRLYLEKSTMELGLYEGVKERLLECIWQEKIDRRNTSSLTH